MLCSLCVDEFTETEVSDLDIALRIQKNVLRLDVIMDDGLSAWFILAHIFQSVEQLSQDEFSFSFF